MNLIDLNSKSEFYRLLAYSLNNTKHMVACLISETHAADVIKAITEIFCRIYRCSESSDLGWKISTEICRSLASGTLCCVTETDLSGLLKYLESATRPSCDLLIFNEYDQATPDLPPAVLALYDSVTEVRCIGADDTQDCIRMAAILDKISGFTTDMGKISGFSEIVLNALAKDLTPDRWRLSEDYGTDNDPLFCHRGVFEFIIPYDKATSRQQHFFRTTPLFATMFAMYRRAVEDNHCLFVSTVSAIRHVDIWRPFWIVYALLLIAMCEPDTGDRYLAETAFAEIILEAEEEHQLDSAMSFIAHQLGIKSPVQSSATEEMRLTFPTAVSNWEKNICTK